jgi:hypothetical protein
LRGTHIEGTTSVGRATRRLRSTPKEHEECR